MSVQPRTMILHEAVDSLKLPGRDEALRVETVMGDTDWKGKCVNFAVSARGDPAQKYHINCAFTAPDVPLPPH